MAQKLMYEDKELLRTESAIKDSNTNSGRNTLSSTKTKSLIDQQSAIDDNVTATNKEWSSAKIKEVAESTLESRMSGTYDSTYRAYTIKGAVDKVILNGVTYGGSPERSI